jgi:DNA-directed RNA polymerase II subunit RPB1
MINRGFSVGLKDCYSDRTEIKHVISECIKEADSLSISDPYLKEIKINNILNKARDIGIKIATNFMDENNSLRNMVESGSKGDFVNIAQISGLLGQQNVNGTRIKPELSNGLRTSSHYDFKNNNYESRGFVSGSFSEGLNPRELFYHAATGREGLVTTAVKTATSGYISRRMMKLMEDYQVNNDLTVRTSLGDIVQFNYGDDNFDPSKLLMLNGKLTCVNIGRLVDKLNRKYEKEY